MDFILSLTHFCEVHGPKSVLCTQVLPLECALCLPPSPSLHPRSSFESIATQVHDSEESTDATPFTRPPNLPQNGTNLTLSTDFSGASTTVDSESNSPNIERHPLFKSEVQGRDFRPGIRYGRAQEDTCASCSFGVPQDVTDEIPAGAPGSIKEDGKSKNGAPVLRSREFICMRNDQRAKPGTSPHSSFHNSASQDSQTSSSIPSYTSSRSDCHDHVLTYLTAKSPDDPENYSLLRASVIRTLSCEQLPRGTSDGPFCFGDSNTGYTIAHIFRLPDPKARGRRRAYAFVALAGKDTSRAFRACPMVWEAFSVMAQAIEQAATRHQEEQKRKEEVDKESGRTRNYTPVSSFLTQRTNDPDGHPRRAGQFTAQSLAEIVGDETIFAILHQYFVAVLRCLGDRFGGLPLADHPSVHQMVANDEAIGQRRSSEIDIDMVNELQKSRDEDRTPTPMSKHADDIDAAKAKIARSVKRNSQCASLAANVTAQLQAVV